VGVAQVLIFFLILFFNVSLPTRAEYRAFELEIRRTPQSVSPGSSSSPEAGAIDPTPTPATPPAQPGPDSKTAENLPNSANGADPQAPTSRIVITTLDAGQYPEYYYVAPDETIQMQDSWMCWGNTGQGRAPCAKPAKRPNPAPEAVPKP